MQESGDETRATQKVTEWDTGREKLEKSDGHMHIGQEFVSRGKPRVPRMETQEGSALCTNDRIAARETQRSRVGFDLPLNSIRRSGLYWRSG